MRDIGHAATVMQLYGHAYQLERKLHVGGEEEREMAMSRREKETTEKSQHQEKIAAIGF